MTPIMVLSKETILKEYGIYFTEPFLVVKNLKNHKDADLLHRILTIYQKYCTAYTVARASQKYIVDEQVAVKDCRMIFSYEERRAYDSISKECQAVLDAAGTGNKAVGIDLVWEKPVLPKGTFIEELPKLEFDPRKLGKYPN